MKKQFAAVVVVLGICLTGCLPEDVESMKGLLNTLGIDSTVAGVTALVAEPPAAEPPAAPLMRGKDEAEPEEIIGNPFGPEPGIRSTVFVEPPAGTESGNWVKDVEYEGYITKQYISSSKEEGLFSPGDDQTFTIWCPTQLVFEPEYQEEIAVAVIGVYPDDSTEECKFTQPQLIGWDDEHSQYRYEMTFTREQYLFVSHPMVIWDEAGPLLVEFQVTWDNAIAREAAAEEVIAAVPISYAMHNGDQGWWPNLPHADSSYDGDGDNTVARAYLSGGTGQLIDGIWDEMAPGEFTETADDALIWVGWDKFGTMAVVFDFGEEITLSEVAVHCNNQAAGGVELFGSAVVSFSDDGQNWSDGLSYEPTADERAVTGSSFTQIAVDGRGRYCQVEFTAGPKGRWLLLDEFVFTR